MWCAALLFASGVNRVYYELKSCILVGIDDLLTTVSDSYTEIRNKGGLAIQHSSSSGLVITTYQRLLAFRTRIRLSGFRCAVYFEIALKCMERGANYHRSEVLKDKKLLEFILQKDYLDKALDYE
jgi:hypothetical protein